MFVTFEGIDGSGKTTQIQHLYETLTQRGYRVLRTREPGGTDMGDKIRELVLNKMTDHPVHPHTELLLFCASRAQLVHELIKPRLAKGDIVLCDRYADSTLAYQGYGHGLDIAHLEQVIGFATGGLVPDVTVYLDISPQEGLARRRKGTLFGEEWNRLDAMTLQFHQRVYAGYETLIAQTPDRWLRLDATQKPDVIQAQLVEALVERLPAPISRKNSSF